MNTLLISLLSAIAAIALGVNIYLYFRMQRSEKSETSVKAILSEVTDAKAEAARIVSEAETVKQSTLQAIRIEEHNAQQWAVKFNAHKKQAQEELRERKSKAESVIQTLTTRITELRQEFALLDEHAVLQEHGFYEPQYAFATVAEFEKRLQKNRDKQKKMISGETAAVGDMEWTVNGSKTEGHKKVRQTLRLMLRAFNGECDAAIAKINYKNALTMEARIKKAFSAINGLADIQQCRITEEFLKLRLEELFLAHEYQEKLQAEREEQRRIREEEREAERERRRNAELLRQAEIEEERYAQALAEAELAVATAVGKKHDKLVAEIEILKERLANASSLKQRAISQAQLTRMGHIYIISNVGSFGPEVFKIGMTRRLDPNERVIELGDASVPFSFDIHAMIECDDAPTLERALHDEFAHRRLNLENHRKEFFRVTPQEIEIAVKSRAGKIKFKQPFTYEAEAKEWRITQAKMQEMQKGASSK